MIPDGIRIERRHAVLGEERLLGRDALAFLADLHRRFEPERRARLAARAELQRRLDSGQRLDFPPETAARRADPSWSVAPVPADLQDRRVEITGPVDRKMVINALNSGAKVFMACFEDATAPTWANLIEGQLNLADAVAGTIAFHDPASGKSYRLGELPAVLKVRPRGWHLPEKHLLVDGEPISGALFDFGLYLFHTAKALLAKGSGPYFYLPKLEHYLEARLWEQVFRFSEERLGLPAGCIRATVLIETLPGAFHAEDILFELKDHIDGLNCGRWDYIFSYIKKNRADPAKLLPDRAEITMTVPFMRAYCLHVITVCHRRQAFAMGGMAAQIPVKGDPAANQAAFARVRADKEREAADGHDGTWVAHPALVAVATEVFDRLMPGPNQVSRRRDDHATQAQLLEPCGGPRTEQGLRTNIAVGVRYVAAWLNGLGCVPLFNLMEDAATAEISRTQMWHWRRHAARLDDGTVVDAARLRQLFDEELAGIRTEAGERGFAAGRFADAAAMILEMVLAEDCPDFLTLPAYDRLIAEGL
jgi:malate synthase